MGFYRLDAVGKGLDGIFVLVRVGNIWLRDDMSFFLLDCLRNLLLFNSSLKLLLKISLLGWWCLIREANLIYCVFLAVVAEFKMFFADGVLIRSEIRCI